MRLLAPIVAAAFALALFGSIHPAATAAAPDVPRYDLTVTLGNGAIAVDGAIALARKPAGAEEIVLSDRMRDLHVTTFAADGTETTVATTALGTENGQTRWQLDLPQPGPDPLILHVRYAGGGEPRLVYSLGERVSFAAGVNTAWYPQRDDRSSGTGTIRYVVAAGTVVAGTGVEIESAEDRARGTFVFRHDVPTSFAFAAAPYHVARATVGGEPVAAYLLAPRANAPEYLAKCARVLAFLERQFGPHRYGSFALIEVPDAQASAAGFSGASIEGSIFVTSSFLDAPFNTAFYGHEISHQWWGNLIRLRGTRGSQLLDEAMAQFGSLQTVRAFDGADAARRYRETGYPGYIASQSAQGYLDIAAAGLDHPLEDLTGAPSVAHTMADSKGFLVLDMLAQAVGRERFRDNLIRLTSDHAFDSIDWAEYLSAVTAGSSIDANAFAAQWLQRPGVPSFALDWHQRGERVIGTVTQPAPAYDVSIALELRGARGTVASHTIRVHGERTAFSVPAGFPVTQAELDPQFDVLRWTPAMRAHAVARAEVTRGIYAYAVSDAARAAREFESALTRVRADDPYRVRFTAEYYLARLAQKRSDHAEAQRRFRRALAAPTRDPTLLPYAYLRLAEADAALGDQDGARAAAAAALEADAAIQHEAGIRPAVEAVLAKLRTP